MGTANQFCETRRALLTELARKSDEVANAASQLSKLASKNGNATLEDKVDLSNVRTHLKALMHESEDIHQKLRAHRDEHGC
jgi:hypothetical protein